MRATTAVSLLFVALALGLAWAVRGHFGHEWGAAWAGGIGALAVLAAARRRGWTARLPALAALGALGWSIGGMMSYGHIVGYGRGTDFLNVWYGLSMLGVVGGLYGFLGGGFLGLGLEGAPERRPAWASMLAEMVAGAMLAWGVLIAQLGWLMTPPRSELWAACLGAAAALGWHLRRNGFHRALRLAGCSALGAGFGFAFGNFLQTLGSASGAAFNWWNVMEFSLGCFGGAGMAYGVFTRDWPEPLPPEPVANRAGFLFLFLAVPLTNLVQSFEASEFGERAGRLGLALPGRFVALHYLAGACILGVLPALALLAWSRLRGTDGPRRDGWLLFCLILYAAAFVLLGHVKTGFLLGGAGYRPEQLLYWAGLALLYALGRALRRQPPLPAAVEPPGPVAAGPRWSLYLIAFLLLTALMAVVSVGVHDGLPGAQRRF